jgi:hypothetical protein
MPSTPGEVYNGQEIPDGYAKVGVKEVCNDWKNLELDIPGGDGETTLADVTHGYILRNKRYIILKPTDSVTCPKTLSIFISWAAVDYSCFTAISWFTSSATAKEGKKEGAREAG